MNAVGAVAGTLRTFGAQRIDCVEHGLDGACGLERQHVQETRCVVDTLSKPIS